MAETPINKELIEILERVGSEEFKKSSFDEFQELVKASKKFLQIVQQQTEKELSITLREGFVKAFSYDKIYQKMRTNQETVRELTKAQEAFQEKINIFQGKKAALIYYDIKNNKVIVASSKKLSEFYGKFATVNRGRGNIAVRKQIEVLQEQTTSNWRTFQDILNNRSARYHNVLDVALERWKDTKKKYKKEEKYHNTFWWKIFPNEPFIAWSRRYSNRGKIVEGYVAMLMDKDNFQGYIEDNISTLNDYVLEADNIGAVEHQDIVLNINNYRIEFAVKTNRFSTAMIGQYIDYALEILETDFFLSNKINLKLTKNEKNKLDKSTQQLVQESQDDLLIYINKIINQNK